MVSLKAMQIDIAMCTLGVILYPCIKTSTTITYEHGIVIFDRTRPSVDCILFYIIKYWVFGIHK